MTTFHTTGEGTVTIGAFTQIGDGAQIIFTKPGKVTIGDYCTIGPGVKVICSGGDVSIGDWSSLHDHCLVLCGEGVQIGAHCWFGQNCVIDGSGGITIGRGVRIGMYSQLWSHVAAGEQIEGCTLIGERPVVIEDDVWLVGTCIVASGVTLGSRTVALIGSNITKSWPANTVLAGTPAAPKPGLSFYQEVTLTDKWSKLSTWLQEAALELNLTLETSTDGVIVASLATDGEHKLVFAREAQVAKRLRTQLPSFTVCCVETKTYNKQLNGTEQKILKYLSGNKARFNAVN